MQRGLPTTREQDLMEGAITPSPGYPSGYTPTDEERWTDEIAARQGRPFAGGGRVLSSEVDAMQRGLPAANPSKTPEQQWIDDTAALVAARRAAAGAGPGISNRTRQNLGQILSDQTPAAGPNPADIQNPAAGPNPADMRYPAASPTLAPDYPPLAYRQGDYLTTGRVDPGWLY